MTFMESFLSKGMLNPTENSYNMILHSMTSKQASKTKDAPKWAENILEQMIVRDDFPKPSIVTFSTVLQIFVSSRHPHALRHAQALEQR
jgi:hypothetical protein